MDEFTKILPIAFGPFIDHHQGLLACIKKCLLKSFERFSVFYNITNCVNRELDETEVLKNLITERYQRK